MINTPKLKSFLIIGLVILFLAVYGYFQAVPSVEDQGQSLPKIEITPQDFNFGEVEYGQVLNHTFTLKNIGSEILSIERVATSCGCTTAETVLNKINPGQETELLVSYDTGAMSGGHAKNEQERIIYIKSNDPVNPQIEVIIYANVK